MAVIGTWETGGETMFAGSQCWRQEKKEENRDFLNLPFSRFQTWARITSCSWVLCLPVSFLYTGCPVFLSFIFSKTEDWGYLNEDGELGLAYQGLKQVARSNTCLSSCVCFVCSACSCLRFIVFQLGWMQVHRAQFMERCREVGVGPQPGWVDEVREAACWGQGDSTWLWAQIYDPTTGERGNVCLHFLAGGMWIRTDPALAGHSKGYGYHR